MPIKVPDTIDQAAADKLLRDLAKRSNEDASTIDTLKEANQRLEERLADTGRAMGPGAEACARYVRPDGKVLLRGIEIKHDGRTVDLAYSEESDTTPGFMVHGYLDDPNPKDELQRDMQRTVNNRNIARQVLAAARVRKGDDRPISTPLHDAEIRRLAEFLPEPLKRTFNGSSGTGAEWIPTDVYPEIQRAMVLQYERMVPGLFREIPVLRSGTLPLLTAGFLPYLQGTIGADPARLLTSDAATGDTTISLKTIAAMTVVGMDAMEEALFSVGALFNEQMAYALVSAEADAIINGQASTTSVDTGLATWNPGSAWPAAPGATTASHLKAWNGLRHLAIDASLATDRSTFSFATWGADKAACVGPKSQPGSMAYIINELAAWKNFYTLDQVATAEKFGADATVFKGAAMRVAGSDIVESQFMTSDLTTAGIYDGATTTKAGALHVITAAYVRAARYGVQLFNQVDNTRGVIYLGGKTRRQFLQVNSSDSPVHYEYNLAKS